MLCQLVLLVLLSSLQPGRLQEGTDVADMFQNINSNIVNLNSLVRSHMKQSAQFRVQMEDSVSSLRADLSSLNDSVSSLSMRLQEHKQQTTAELAQLQTSLDTTQASLETFTSTLIANAAQLSTDNQEIKATITALECVNTEQSLQLCQNLQNNLTHQLENIQSNGMNVLEYTCGGTEGWRRVVYLDMTDPSTTCPSGWNMTGHSKRTCRRATDGWNTCDSVTFPVSGGEYSRVCGRVKAYQWGATGAFFNSHYGHETIDDAYVDGISVTHNGSRQHIWTLAAGLAENYSKLSLLCPCDTDVHYTTPLPPFVGNDYFCESGVNERWGGSRHFTLHSNDTLWDGEDCLSSSTCCLQNNPPFFLKQLPTPTTDDIEARICLRGDLSRANIAVELIELYVQ